MEVCIENLRRLGTSGPSPLGDGGDLRDRAEGLFLDPRSAGILDCDLPRSWGCARQSSEEKEAFFKKLPAGWMLMHRAQGFLPLEIHHTAKQPTLLQCVHL